MNQQQAPAYSPEWQGAQAQKERDRLIADHIKQTEQELRHVSK